MESILLLELIGTLSPLQNASSPDEISVESISEWRRSLRNEIEKTSEVPRPTRGIYNKLKSVWDEFGGK
jgi:hypothetical protein